MTGDSDAHPDRSPPARPATVARFDGFSALDREAGEKEPDDGPDDGRSSAPVAGFDSAGRSSAVVAGLDRLGDRSRSGVAVAGFDGLDATPPPVGPVAHLDALDGRTSNPRTGRSAAGQHDRGGSTGRPEPPAPDPARLGSHGPPVSADDRATGADSSEDDGIPPDRPLPRGRRRGARVGRLGPDAPRRDVPGSDVPGSDRPGADTDAVADPVAVAREICLRLLTDRARTREELGRALARKGVPAEAAATVLDRFDEVGLIDDAAFAGQWVRSRHNHRGLGRRAIAVELRRKGVSDDVAGEALAEVDAESEARRARELVDRKLRSLAVGSAEQRAVAGRRLVGMLARKGYGAGTAYRIVREALAERGAEAYELESEPADG
jgi:regulatory protein